MIRRAAALLLAAGLAAVGPPAQAQPSPPDTITVTTTTRGAIAALGAEAELRCLDRLRARCLAETVLARAAAATPQSLPAADVTNAVLEALTTGGHAATLQALRPLFEAISGKDGSGYVTSAVALARAGLPELARRVLSADDDEEERQRASANLAAVTLDQDDLALAERLAGRLGPEQRSIQEAWIQGLAAAASGDRSAFEFLLGSLARDPAFGEQFNGDPSFDERPWGDVVIMPEDNIAGGPTFAGWFQDCVLIGDVTALTIFRGDQEYAGLRIRHLLAARGFAILGDADRAFQEADAIRFPGGRLSAYEAIVRRLPAQRRVVDERVVALAAAQPLEGTLRVAGIAALIRLGRLDEAETALLRLAEERGDRRNEIGSMMWPRLAAAHARLGPANAYRTGRMSDLAFGMARRSLERDGGGADQAETGAQQAADRTQLAAWLAATLEAEPGSALSRAVELLRRRAAPYVIESCLARGDRDCFALDLTLQAIALLPAE